MAVGKWNVAQDHIRTANAKEPDNMTYHQAYSDITNGINPLKKDPFSSFFDFGDMGGAHTYTYTSPNQNTRTYTARRGGCVSKIIKKILIIIIKKIIINIIKIRQFNIIGKMQSGIKDIENFYAEILLK